MRLVLLVVVLAAAVAMFGQAAAADSLTVTTTTVSTGDAFVTDGPNGTYVTYNYGGAGGLEVSGTTASRSDQTTEPHRGQADTVIRFNLASAKSSFDAQYGVGQWTISSATLDVCAEAPASSGHYSNAIFNDPHSGQFSVKWMADDSWAEGTGSPGGTPKTDGITWNTLGSFLGGGDLALGTFSYTPPPAGSGNNREDKYTLDLPAGFLSDLTAGGDVSLLLLPASDDVSLLFSSRSNAGQPPLPTLMLTAVPEPATMLLLAAGGLSLLGRRRRRRAG